MKEDIVLNGAEGADNTYVVPMSCTNCGKRTRKKIPLSITIQDYDPVCPTCLCRTLVKEKQDYSL